LSEALEQENQLVNETATAVKEVVLETVLEPVLETVLAPVLEKMNLLQLFQDLLVNNRSKLENFSVKLPENMQKYILLLIVNNESLFNNIEESLKKIIADNKIDSKDIPELLVLVGKIYEIIYKSKDFKCKADYFEIIKKLLLSAFVLYIEHNVENGKEIITSMEKIIEASIDLIKLKSSIKTPKFCKLF